MNPNSLWEAISPAPAYAGAGEIASDNEFGFMPVYSAGIKT